jgi:predicted nucleotide-binding protein
MRRIYQADKNLADDGREPELFHLQYPGDGPKIEHPRWDPGRGQTIIEKFESHAGRAGFAVVLLTADDVGAAKAAPEHLNPRARQNAILELGYFLAKIGRENVAVVFEEGVELPSDYTGVEYISFADEWRWKLSRELKAAGFDVATPAS